MGNTVPGNVSLPGSPSHSSPGSSSGPSKHEDAESSAPRAPGQTAPGGPAHPQRAAALLQSAPNLAQMDLKDLASLMPPGTSNEQLETIREKLLQINELQEQHHRKLERSASEPNAVRMLSNEHLNELSESNLSTAVVNSSRYKTELCRPFEESGVCKYGDKCQFAHGYQELRTLTRHPKYKTELCCTFHTTGLCPYGSRCHFIHNPDENRATKILPPSSSSLQQQVNQQQMAAAAAASANSGLAQQQQQTGAHGSAHHHHQTASSATSGSGSNAGPMPPQHYHSGSNNGNNNSKPLHNSLSSPAIGMSSMNHMGSGHQQHQVQQQSGAPHQNGISLRSLSLGSSVGSSSGGSSGDLSPSSSPGMFDDPFSTGFYSSTSRGFLSASNPLFSAFTNSVDLEMSNLAAAFSAAESNSSNHHHQQQQQQQRSSPSGFGSQLSLLSSSVSAGPWSSPLSTSSDVMFNFSSSSAATSSHSGNGGGLLSTSTTSSSSSSAGSAGLGCQMMFGGVDSLLTGATGNGLQQQQHLHHHQSSPVDSLTFDFDAISLGGGASSSASSSAGSLSPGARRQGAFGAASHPVQPLTRLPIFNQLAHSD